MTQDLCEKFWKGLGATGSAGNRRLRGLRVSWYGKREFKLYETLIGGEYPLIEVFLDPSDEEKVKLEVLLGGLERLSKAEAVVYKDYEQGSWHYFVCPDITEWPGVSPLARETTFRAAVIAAILKLLEEK